MDKPSIFHRYIRPQPWLRWHIDSRDFSTVREETLQVVLRGLEAHVAHPNGILASFCSVPIGFRVLGGGSRTIIQLSFLQYAFGVVGLSSLLFGEPFLPTALSMREDRFTIIRLFIFCGYELGIFLIDGFLFGL
jgi:hypothetical protein